MSILSSGDASPQSHDMRVVYGLGLDGEELVFIPQAKAEEYTAIRAAVDASGTWGELLDRLALCSKEAHQHIVDHMDDEIGLGDPHTPGDAWGYTDYEWPPYPREEQLSWVPQDIISKFGEYGASRTSGQWVARYDTKDHSLLAAFEAHGFILIRDDALVASASGWSPGENTR